MHYNLLHLPLVRHLVFMDYKVNLSAKLACSDPIETEAQNMQYHNALAAPAQT